MSPEGSVTILIEQLKAGDSGAVGPLWERYFEKLVQLARKRMQGARPKVVDEEDVALSALNNLFCGVQEQRFPQLLDRDSLWRLLVVLTARKACHAIRDECRLKRGGGDVLDETTLAAAFPESEEAGLAAIIGAEPTPEFAAQVAEECRRLLDSLNDELRFIAVHRMEGFSNEEIAAKLHWPVRRVERRLSTIRELWAGSASA
jgi:DNA-directed RNA polymerase specialized sigma24 family protein